MSGLKGRGECFAKPTIPAYGHVAGATDFFARLSQQKGVDLAFLSTHPAPEQRVVELKRLIEQRNYQIGERSPLPKSLRST